MDLLQTLCKAVKKVWVAVDQMPYSIVSQDQAGPSEERPVDSLSTTPWTRIQIVGQALDLGMLELNVVVKDIGDVDFDFSIVHMYQLYTI